MKSCCTRRLQRCTSVLLGVGATCTFRPDVRAKRSRALFRQIRVYGSISCTHGEIETMTNAFETKKAQFEEWLKTQPLSVGLIAHLEMTIQCHGPHNLVSISPEHSNNPCRLKLVWHPRRVLFKVRSVYKSPNLVSIESAFIFIVESLDFSFQAALDSWLVTPCKLQVVSLVTPSVW